MGLVGRIRLGAYLGIHVLPLPATPTAGVQVPSQTQIVWNWQAVQGATGYKFNAVDDFGTATDMGTAQTKTETNLTCNTAYTRYVWAYNACVSLPAVLTQITNACSFSCGSITISHLAGIVAPVSKTVTYGTVTNIAGEPSKCWITSNLGSDHQATAVNDATEESAGWYWQFNYKQGYKHDGINRTPNTNWINPISEYSDWLPANDPCAIELGGIWRIPTSTEWSNVDNAGSWTMWTGPWNSPLKMHAAGDIKYNTAALNWRGEDGNYWSSTHISATIGSYLNFNSSLSGMYTNDKSYGFSLRCLKDAMSNLYIGQSYQGGIIFYIDETGQHGLISSTSDQSMGAAWGCYGTLIGGTYTAIGTGQANTSIIISGCSAAGTAARICDDLILNGYSDWYLPSKDELNQMYLQKDIVGGFGSNYYWSSSEYNANTAFLQTFGDGLQPNFHKGDGNYVRAIRAF